MRSFTDNSKEYIIFADEKGLTCTCMDFQVRGGSHRYEFMEGNERHEIQACKHIGQHIANQGAEVIELHPWGRKKIEPQKTT